MTYNYHIPHQVQVKSNTIAQDFNGVDAKNHPNGLNLFEKHTKKNFHLIACQFTAECIFWKTSTKKASRRTLFLLTPMPPSKRNNIKPDKRNNIILNPAKGIRPNQRNKTQPKE